MQAAQERYDKAVAGRPERLVSGSDDFTMFMWEPSTSKKAVARMTGHMQLINQARLTWLSTLSPHVILQSWGPSRSAGWVPVLQAPVLSISTRAELRVGWIVTDGECVPNAGGVLARWEVVCERVL